MSGIEIRFCLPSIQENSCLLHDVQARWPQAAVWPSGRAGEEEYETAADHGVARGWYADAVGVRVLNADPFDETRS